MGSSWGSSWGTSWGNAWGAPTGAGCTWGGSWGTSWGESWCPGDTPPEPTVILIGGDDAPRRRRKPRTRKEQHDLFRELETTIHQLLHPDLVEVGAGSVELREESGRSVPDLEIAMGGLRLLAAQDRELLQRVGHLRVQIEAVQARRQRELEQDEEDALLWLF